MILPAFFAPKTEIFYQPADSDEHILWKEMTEIVPITNEAHYKKDY